MAKRKDTLYYVETDRGCGLRAAQNIQQARAEEIRTAGTDGFKGVRLATQADVAWVGAMNRTCAGRRSEACAAWRSLPI